MPLSWLWPAKAAFLSGPWTPPPCLPGECQQLVFNLGLRAVAILGVVRRAGRRSSLSSQGGGAENNLEEGKELVGASGIVESMYLWIIK